MRGISFKIENMSNNILCDILIGLNIENWFWCISEDEIYTNEYKVFFEDHIMSGSTFFRKIQEEPYIIFAKLIAFINNSDLKPINNYKEFIDRNECPLIALITDSIFVEIYCKDANNIETIKKNALNMACNDINYITDENDVRYTFSNIF